MAFLLPLLIVIVTSILGLMGGFLLIYYQKWAKFISKYLINFAIGALFGIVFLDIIPEIAKQSASNYVFIFVLLGILIFYILEKSLIYYHHHSVEHVWHDTHTKEEQAHHVGYLITFGDALHNFIDGLVIATSFLVDFRLGILTSITVLLHELPQEIGEFAIMLHKGFKRSKIVLYNLLAQSLAVVGFILGYLYLSSFKDVQFNILGFAAGGFIYIACTDLLPETHREKTLKKSIIQVVLLLLGIFVIGYVGYLLE